MRYICNTMEYFGLNYTLKYGIYLAKFKEFIYSKILDIFGKNSGIYLAKLWDILVHGIY